MRSEREETDLSAVLLEDDFSRRSLAHLLLLQRDGWRMTTSQGRTKLQERKGRNLLSFFSCSSQSSSCWWMLLCTFSFILLLFSIMLPCHPVPSLTHMIQSVQKKKKTATCSRHNILGISSSPFNSIFYCFIITLRSSRSARMNWRHSIATPMNFFCFFRHSDPLKQHHPSTIQSP